MHVVDEQAILHALPCLAACRRRTYSGSDAAARAAAVALAGHAGAQQLPAGYRAPCSPPGGHCLLQGQPPGRVAVAAAGGHACGAACCWLLLTTASREAQRQHAHNCKQGSAAPARTQLQAGKRSASTHTPASREAQRQHAQLQAREAQRQHAHNCQQGSAAPARTQLQPGKRSASTHMQHIQCSGGTLASRRAAQRRACMATTWHDVACPVLCRHRWRRQAPACAP
jgi:hypothetical protein